MTTFMASQAHRSRFASRWASVSGPVPTPTPVKVTDLDEQWSLYDDAALEHNLFSVPSPTKTQYRGLNHQPSLTKFRRLSPHYTQPDLFDRYASSEEEPSSIPDSDSGSYLDLCDEVPEQSSKPKAVPEPSSAKAKHLVTHIDDSTDEECEAQTAVAVPVLLLGRPKMVDVSSVASLAPIRRRKRPSVDRAVPSPGPVQPTTFKPAIRSFSTSEQSSAAAIRRRQEFQPAPTRFSVSAQAAADFECSPMQRPVSRFPPAPMKTSTYSHSHSHSAPELEPFDSCDFSSFSWLSSLIDSTPSTQSSSSKHADEELRKQSVATSTPSRERRPSFRMPGRTLSYAKKQEACHPSKFFQPSPVKSMARAAVDKTELPPLPPMHIAKNSI